MRWRFHTNRDGTNYDEEFVKKGKKYSLTQKHLKKAREIIQVSKVSKSLKHTLFQIRPRLPYRQTEGFVRTLFREMSISIELPNFRTIHYRHNPEEFHFDHLPDNPKDLPQGFVIVLDSTSMKLTNRGEWLSKKHGKKRRRSWIKVHVAIDTSSGKVLGMKVTDNKTHDSQCAVELVEDSIKRVESLGGNVKEVIADTGVDSQEISKHLVSRGIKPVIKVRKDAVITGSRAIDDVVREIRKGRKRWKERNSYGRRWHVESLFWSFERWFGEYVSGVKFENVRKELMFEVKITSMFLGGSVGMVVR